MDWVAGPIDPSRVGLAAQRTLLQAVADSASCDAAYAKRRRLAAARRGHRRGRRVVPAAGCVTTGACLPGLACIGFDVLRDGFVSGAYTEFDCSLQGRTCAGARRVTARTSRRRRL